MSRKKIWIITIVHYTVYLPTGITLRATVSGADDGVVRKKDRATLIIIVC